jgi:hypothetical protein
MLRQRRDIDLNKVSIKKRVDVDWNKLSEWCTKDDTKLTVERNSLWTTLSGPLEEADKVIRDKFGLTGKSNVIWCPPSEEADSVVTPPRLVFTRCVVSSVDTIMTVQISKSLSKEVFLRAGEVYSISMIPATFRFDTRSNVTIPQRKGFRSKSFKHRLKSRNVFVFSYSPDMPVEEKERVVTQEMLDDEDMQESLNLLDEMEAPELVPFEEIEEDN